MNTLITSGNVASVATKSCLILLVRLLKLVREEYYLQQSKLMGLDRILGSAGSSDRGLCLRKSDWAGQLLRLLVAAVPS